MIVGTAGHVDHGKTTLVRALTGVDTDRLPEEKARGISIELGYAYLDLPPPASDPARGPCRIGFVDVPGHERLVRTMLAGATGIDFGLLVVAADDGPMPQTREHLAVLALLGLERGAVVLTKVDRVDAARLAAVRAELVELLAGTPLAAAPVLAVSALTGAGLDALRELLAEAAGTPTPGAGGALDHPDDRRPTLADGATIDPGVAGFRLAVDRVFTLAGIGTVVTGSVHAGRVRIGDELEVAPGAGRTLRARVRSLHAADRPVDAAGPGERCALGLAGIERDQVGRGRWLVAPGVALATDRLDVRLDLWRDEPGALKSGTTVHLHLGTADVLASVAVLGEVGASDAEEAPRPVDSLAPGRRAWAQLVTREPIAAWHGDRFVLRDAAAGRTLGGGRVLDPFAPARYRRTPQRLAELAALGAATPTRRLVRRLAVAPLGVSLERWVRAEARLGAAAPASSSADWLIDAAARGAIEARASTALGAFHAAHPDLPGMDTAALRRRVVPRLPEALWRDLLAVLGDRGEIVRQSTFACLPEHALQLSTGDAELLARIEPRIEAAGREGAWVRDLARCDPLDEPRLRAALARLARHGSLQQVVRDLYWTNATVATLAATARTIAENNPDGGVTVGAFRDALGIGRKRAIQLLEYFDRLGWLQRRGETRRIRADGPLAGPAADPVPGPATPATASPGPRALSGALSGRC